VSSANIDPQRLQAALQKATAELLAQRNADGYWEGELSSSALSTATAVTTLALALKHATNPQSSILNLQSSIQSGSKWLAEHQNADGGWGDTTKSLSNISTTTLCWAAFGAADVDAKFATTVQQAELWLTQRAGSIEPGPLAKAIIARYGKDRTFSVPILTMCALAGRLGSGREAWQHVIPLPFELAAFPHRFFAALRLPVVSYALPALIAIGQARHVHAPSRNPFARWIRHAAREKTLRKLTEIQPVNGGFLEATPLTSFVTMSLLASGQANHIVAQRGLEFLIKSQRADGSWRIDTNLSTWCTTLAIDAIPRCQIPDPQSSIDWLLTQQYKAEHPYTHAAPGGWAWTDLPGGVPDADDTAGALVALAALRDQANGEPERLVTAAKSGVAWLLDLQNHDGGIPTFCRGWGALPFDQSSPDITAHAIRGWLDWLKEMPAPLQRRMAHGLDRAVRFLVESQRTDGSWVPLWFGNQFHPAEENPIYGTSRVLGALQRLIAFKMDLPRDGGIRDLPTAAYRRGMEWLVNAQRTDGSWGESEHGGSIEETALSVQALSSLLNFGSVVDDAQGVAAAAERGIRWLVERVENGSWTDPAPLGFYFARLWYFERLYPMVFTVGALRQATLWAGVERSQG
jgi:squalene-hopene/tetraprenyl-beta-curcumene cyclase